MKSSSFSVLFVLLFSTTIMFASASVSYSQYTVIQITNSDGEDSASHPQINARGEVVWSKCDTEYCHASGDGDHEIFLHDGTSTTQLTNNDYYDGSPKINDIGHVAWAGDNEIFLYDGTSTTQITNDSYYYKSAHINDNGYVVLRTWSGEIFLYDGTSTTQIMNDVFFAFNLQINNNGYVVWDELGPLMKNEIFLYDGTSTTQLTNNAFHNFAPQINNNNFVVWLGSDGSDSEVFLFDGTSTIQLTNNDYSEQSPQINDSGHVAWAGDNEIFLYDGTSTTQITNDSYSDRNPQINDNGYVVWQGDDGSDYEIFLYDGRSTTQLTNNGYRDEYPMINDNGWVVWDECDGDTGGDSYCDTGYEIFLAIPCAVDNDYDDDMYMSVFCGGDDCMDGNPDVNPGETEVCDGLDTDCDGSPESDEVDNDSDDVMICQGDCNDSNRYIFPTNPNANCDCAEPNPQGTEESEAAGNCADGIDNDCNGLVDNCGQPGFCLDRGGCCGETSACGEGEACVKKQGICSTWMSGEDVIPCDLDSDCDPPSWCAPVGQCLGGEYHGARCYTSPANGICGAGWFFGLFTVCRTDEDCPWYPEDHCVLDDFCMGWPCLSCQTSCSIATATFGTDLEGGIDILQSFRDEYLVNHAAGRAFITVYYKYSPPIADYIAERPWLRSLMRIWLLPLIGLVSLFV